MKKFMFILSTTLAFSILLTSCCRSGCEMWEDTKTCGRYMGKGVRSLFGQHTDPREYVAYSETWDDEAQYLPLADEDPYHPPFMSEFQAATPSAKESPGDPGSPIPGINGFLTPTNILAALFAHIHFETDNYSMSGNDNLSTLREIATYLTNHPNMHVFIEGHADERGAAAYNLALGSRRANAVRNFLIQKGTNPDQLFTISYGKERPIAMNHAEVAWCQNRRAQFKIYEK